MQVKKQQLDPDMEILTGSKLWKEFDKVGYCHPDYLTSVQSISYEMQGWVNHKLESRFPGEIHNLRYADDTTFMAESEEDLKSLLMRVKEESEKANLKLNIKKNKIMASGPITSWCIFIEGVKVEARQVLFSWAPKSLQMVTAAMKLKDTCSLEERLWQT